MYVCVLVYSITYHICTTYYIFHGSRRQDEDLQPVPLLPRRQPGAAGCHGRLPPALRARGRHRLREDAPELSNRSMSR